MRGTTWRTAAVALLLALGGCLGSDPQDGGEGSSTGSPTAGPPRPQATLPQNETREGTWVASAPTVSVQNAEVFRFAAQERTHVRLRIQVDYPAVLEYVVMDVTGGSREMLLAEESDPVSDWTVDLTLDPADYELWASLRTGGPTSYVVDVGFTWPGPDGSTFQGTRHQAHNPAQG